MPVARIDVAVMLTTQTQRFDLLERSRTIAVVGASATATRPSHDVFMALRQMPSYDATPVSPALNDELGGVRAFPTLAAYVAECGAPDIVNVFRKPQDAAQVAREAVHVGARAIWFQLGVASDEAIAVATSASLDVVVEACIKVDARALAQARSAEVKKRAE